MILRLWKNGILIYRNEIEYMCQYDDKALEISDTKNNRVWFKGNDYTALELRKD